MNESSWFAGINEFMSSSLQQAGTYLPRVLLAAALLLAGLLTANLLKRWSSRMISGGLERYFRDPAVKGELERTGVRKLIPDFAGHLLFWFVLLFFVAAAIETLGLPVVTNLLSVIAAYLPNVLAGAAIVVLGLLGGILARSAVVGLLARAQVPYRDLVGRAVQVTILLVATVTGIDQIGIDSTFLIIIIGSGFGIMLGAAALAFGLGARTEVSNLLASHYLLKKVRVGQRARIAGVEGRILEITPNAVVIESTEGRVVIPAKKFSEEMTVLLQDGP